MPARSWTAVCGVLVSFTGKALLEKGMRRSRGEAYERCRQHQRFYPPTAPASALRRAAATVRQQTRGLAELFDLQRTGQDTWVGLTDGMRLPQLFGRQLVGQSIVAAAVLAGIMLLIGLVIGGMATRMGPVIGALAVVYLPYYTSGFGQGQAAAVLFAVVLIAVIFVAPAGVMGGITSWTRRFFHVVPAVPAFVLDRAVAPSADPEPEPQLPLPSDAPRSR